MHVQVKWRENTAGARVAELPQCGISGEPLCILHVAYRRSLSWGEAARPLDIQASARTFGGTRTLDYQSLIRHPAGRSIKPGIDCIRKTKSLGFRAHIPKQQSGTDLR
jgi:hypothetical protein